MPYSLIKTNGIQLTIVQDGTVDTTTDLVFVGKNYTGYGNPVNENFLKLLENFANGTAPKKPLTGQLWYDTTNKRMKVYDGRKFKSVGIIDYGIQRPTGMNPGDLHFNQNSKKLFAYDGVEWISIGPADFAAGGVGLVSSSITDNSSNNYPAYVMTLGNNTATIFSEVSRYDLPSNSAYFNKFKRIYPGITLSDTNTSGISAHNNGFSINGTILWGTAASALGLVKYDNGVISLINSNNITLKTDLSSGSDFPLVVLDDNGITVGVQRVFQMHVTSGNVSNLSAINGNRIQINLKTNLGTYTNVLNIDGSGGYALTPNSSLPVNIGSSGNRFNGIFANTLTALLITGTNISVVNAFANSVNSNSITSPSANINNVTSRNVDSQTINVNTLTATTVSGTTISGTNIFGGAVFDNGIRVINAATILDYGVRSLSGTANQINVSASTGNVTLSLPSTVAVNSLSAAVISGTAVYDNGQRVLTLATIPSAGVSAVSGTAGQILVNGLIGASTGSVSLSFPPNVSMNTLGVTTVNATSITVNGNNVFNTYSNGTTGLTNVASNPGELQLGGTLSVAAGGTGANNTSTARANLGAQATLVSGVNIKSINGESLLGSGDLKPFPSGTAMIFAQTSAPTGWTKVTTYNDAALRVVSGSASSGGTVDFTAAFTSKSVSGTVGDTTLTTDQIPSHSHSVAQNSNSTSPLTNSPGSRLASFGAYGGNERYLLSASTGGADAGITGTTGSGQSHTHSFTGTAIDLSVKYVDVIIATKD